MDPYVYPGTLVLRNKFNLRDPKAARNFEMDAAAQRIAEGIPRVDLSVAGYRAIHRHIFQDVYEWAGEFRTVNLSKPGALFCKVGYVSRELDKRFALIAASDHPFTAREFVEAAAEHVSELNAIHPFREGNGRVMRAFLEVYGVHKGHEVFIERIDPKQWFAASVESFQTANNDSMRAVIAPCIGDNQAKAERLSQMEQDQAEAQRTGGQRAKGPRHDL